MTITELLTLVRVRLLALEQQRTNAAAIGDVDRVVALDVEREETETTLAQLESLT